MIPSIVVNLNIHGAVGNWYKGAHKPLITKEEFDIVQDLLGRKGRPRPKKHKFAYTGLMRCGECGASITAEKRVKTQKNGNVHRYIYYHCTKKIKPCSQKTIEESALESQVAEVLESLRIPKEFQEWSLKCLKEQNETESKSRSAVLESQQRAYNGCLQRIDRLIDMRTRNEVNELQFKTKMEQLETEKKKMKEQLDDTDNRADQWIETAKNAFTFAQFASQKFSTGSLEVKAGILQALGSNLTLKDKKLHIDLEKSLFLISETYQEALDQGVRFEPLENTVNKGKTDALTSASSIWLPSWDSNQQLNYNISIPF